MLDLNKVTRYRNVAVCVFDNNKRKTAGELVQVCWPPNERRTNVSPISLDWRYSISESSYTFCRLSLLDRIPHATKL